jgi:chromosomal replication initiator protein
VTKNSSTSFILKTSDHVTENSPAENPGKLNTGIDTEAKLIWEKFISLLSDNLKSSEIKTWFSVIKPKRYSENNLVISVPSKDYYGLIESRYNKILAKIVETLLGPGGTLKYEVEQMDLFNAMSEDGTGYRQAAPENSSRVIELNKHSHSNIKLISNPDEDNFSSNINPRNTFDNFVKGESNELAVAAAYAITNNPGKIYNPYFIYGGVGLGKTHLAQAIGNEIIKKYPDKKVYYTTAPDFTTQFTTNIAQSRIDFSQHKNGTKQLDSFYKSLDVLILDDIQYLSGKEKTQDFMYQIFNTLYNEKKHVIFSSDKPINLIKGIEERLISRFQWGITVDIQAPNWEMRVAIIQKKLEDTNTFVPEEIIHFIATNVKDSIRTIEGVIVGMIAESVIRNKGEITMDIAEKVIGRVVGSVKRAKNISIENIIYTVAGYYNISENQILSRKRTKEVALARQVAMFLAKELTSLTLETIGLNFGGKDHATVLYSYNTISEQMKKNPEIGNQILEIKDRLKNL